MSQIRKNFSQLVLGCAIRRLYGSCRLVRITLYRQPFRCKPQESKSSLRSMAISRIAEKAADAVVAIETTIKSDDSTRSFL